jgi:predicted small lipoprotein YifL
MSSLALIAVLLGALTIAACGRKSGLDPPPSASAAPAETESKGLPGSIGSDIALGRGNKRELPPPPAPKRSLPIDVLLN